MSLYDRRTASEKPLGSLWDLSMYMMDHGAQEGWRKQKPSSPGDTEYIKQFDGVWYMLTWRDSGFSRQVYLRPTRNAIRPSGDDDDAWRDAYKKTSAWVELDGHTTIKDIEAKILELVKVYKQLATPRKRLDTSRITYRPRHDDSGNFLMKDMGTLEGDEALKKWRLDVENILQREIDGGNTNEDWQTRSLVLNILENYGLRLEGVSRDLMARYIRAILDSMAKRNKIVKDTNYRNDPRWLSKKGT